jgi:lipopolysaccharide/colanic/teichoic acid biosynthesis glycosyltransferase
MALVGPRPESSERVRRYSDWQRQRLTVRPGLTGLAQVHGLREQHSSEEKSRYDMQYIHQWSLFMDVSLLLQTVWTLVVRLFSPAHLAIVQPGWTPVPPPSQAAEVEYADRTHSCAD